MMATPVPQHHSETVVAGGVDTQEGKEQYGKAPKRRTAITEKGQRDADNRKHSDNHSDIDGQVKKDNCRYGITVDAAEDCPLTFGKLNDAHQQQGKKCQHECRAPKALLLAYGTEYKIGILGSGT